MTRYGSDSDLAAQNATSAIPPTADMFCQSDHVRKVPTAGSCFRRDPSVAVRPLTLTLPIEGAYNSLARKNCAGQFGGSNGELVSFQLEEPNLGRTGQNLVPR
jgi:hypothetical protein